MSVALQPILALFDEKESGQDARTTNVNAVQALANILKSSLGPLGLDKLLVDNVGDVTITNDGATLLKQLEVTHPAARLVVELSQLQDQEVGDGTTSVVLIAAELLKRANNQVKNGIHPTAIISGYKLAMREASKHLKGTLSIPTSNLEEDTFLSVAKTTLSSKYIGADVDHFAAMVVKGIEMIKYETKAGLIKCPVKSINILKCHGRSAKESQLLDGYALARLTRASNAMPQYIKNAKIALLDFNLRQHRMQLGVQIEISNPAELEKIRERERDITKSKIEKIIKAGANVILTTQGIDDLALKYFVEAKCIAVRRVDREDMKRLATCTGGTICLTMADISGEETFRAASLGQCKEVYEERVGDWDFLFFKGCQSSKAMSMILRGPNETCLDEMERSIHDALCAVAKAYECRHFCVGGGAVETALYMYLDDFGRAIGSKEQVAIREFAESLLIIPKTLALNAGLDSLEILGKLIQRHTKPKDKELPHCIGLDLINNDVQDNLKAGIIEPAVSKLKMLRFATEAAITILRIDDLIKLQPEQQHNPQNPDAPY